MQEALIVRDILGLPSFEGARVIAGSSGLDNEVTGAMVLEAVDIEDWGKSGQLIITSFFATERLSDEELESFFRTMSSIGISAVAFKPERLFNEAPQLVIDLCDDFDLPLIRLDKAVKYDAILMDVMGHIIDANLTLLNRFYSAHQQTMSLALEEPSILDVLLSLKRTIRRDVTFIDVSRDHRIGTDADLAAFADYRVEREESAPYQTHDYFSTWLDRGEDMEPERALAVRIPSTDGADYFLIVHNDDEDLSRLDTMTVENIVELLQMEILKRNAIRQKLFIQNNNVMHDLLLDRFGTQERVDAALSQLHIEHHPLYEVLLVSIHLKHHADADRQEEMLMVVRRTLQERYPEMAFYSNGYRISFLHNFRNAQSGIDCAFVQRELSALHDDPSLPEFTYLAVLSSTTDRYAIPTANQETVSIYRLFDERDHVDEVVRVDELGLYRFLLSIRDPNELLTYVDQRVKRLAEERPELFRTLIRFCENGRSYSKTAAQLYLHPKTVRYRIDRIRELYGIDVSEAEVFMQVMFTDRILFLDGGHSSSAERGGDTD